MKWLTSKLVYSPLGSSKFLLIERWAFFTPTKKKLPTKQKTQEILCQIGQEGSPFCNCQRQQVQLKKTGPESSLDNSLPLKTDAWKRILSYGNFSGENSLWNFREIHIKQPKTMFCWRIQRFVMSDDVGMYVNITGQITIFHQPRFPWNKWIALTKLPFGVRSREVGIIWPDICTYIHRGSRPAPIFKNDGLPFGWW